MVDWTILSPTFLTAVVEWAGAVVTVLAVGPGDDEGQLRGRRTMTKRMIAARE